MTERFSTYQEASSYAKSQAQRTGKSVSLTRFGESWVVESQHSYSDPQKATNEPKSDEPVSAIESFGPENNSRLRLLKGYYLGRRIQQSPNREIAVRYIEFAIRAIQSQNNALDKVILYAVAEAEYCRGTEQAILKRKKLQEYSAIVDDGDAFSLYMSIESATETRVKAYGMQKGIISDAGVIESSSWMDTFGNSHVIDYAANIVGINIEYLSDSELHFLQKVSLVELMKIDGMDALKLNP